MPARSFQDRCRCFANVRDELIRHVIEIRDQRRRVCFGIRVSSIVYFMELGEMGWFLCNKRIAAQTVQNSVVVERNEIVIPRLWPRRRRNGLSPRVKL